MAEAPDALAAQHTFEKQVRNMFCVFRKGREWPAPSSPLIVLLEKKEKKKEFCAWKFA